VMAKEAYDYDQGCVECYNSITKMRSHTQDCKILGCMNNGRLTIIQRKPPRTKKRTLSARLRNGFLNDRNDQTSRLHTRLETVLSNLL
jgi:hypothetical protein